MRRGLGETEFWGDCWAWAPKAEFQCWKMPEGSQAGVGCVSLLMTGSRA
jgi:hypothetical protein